MFALLSGLTDVTDYLLLLEGNPNDLSKRKKNDDKPSPKSSLPNDNNIVGKR